MRTASPALKALLAQETVRLFAVVKISLTDGTFVYLTDCDTDIVVDGNFYRSAVGFNASALQLAVTLATENLQLDLMPSTLTGVGIAYDDIFKNKLDGANVRYSLCDPANAGAGTLVMFSGNVIEIKTGDHDLISLVCQNVFGQDIPIASDNFQQTCRADFGDSRCRFPIDSVKRSFVARKPSPDRTSTVIEGTVDPDGFFNNGTAVFTSGLAKGVAVEIALSITLTPQNSTSTDTHYAFGWKFPLPVDIADGDTLDAWPGCDKTLPGGCTRWQNTINFQGEPYSAGFDASSGSGAITGSTTRAVGTAQIIDQAHTIPGSPGVPAKIAYVTVPVDKYGTSVPPGY